MAIADDGFEGAISVVGPVGGEAELSAGLHHARELRHKIGLHKAALAMARLGPGVGEQDEDAIQRGIGELRDEIARIAAAEFHVGQLLFVNGGQELRNAIDEGFDADNAGVGMAGGLPCQMLAAAKADLEPRLSGAAEQGDRVQRVLGRFWNRECRQEIVDQPLLPL